MNRRHKTSDNTTGNTWVDSTRPSSRPRSWRSPTTTNRSSSLVQCVGVFLILLVFARFTRITWNNNIKNNNNNVKVFDTSLSEEEEAGPWQVTIAHEPRYDLLGSFVLPTLLLHAVAQHENWTLLILPFRGSRQHQILEQLFALKGNVSRDWGTGFQDASHRADYDPMELNDMSYNTMGIFPRVSKDRLVRVSLPWIKRDKIPLPGTELNQVCASQVSSNKTGKYCYIMLGDDPGSISSFIERRGGIDQFFTPTFCAQLRAQFLHRNQYRLLRYDIPPPNSTNLNNHVAPHPAAAASTQPFHVAVHIRRGDILHPDRWIDQQVFANVARHICQTNSNRTTHIHVFSSGPNRDGNWSQMEALAQPSIGTNKADPSVIIPPICSKVYFHLDEVEFDSWTFMIAADALVISPSTFGYVPSLIRYHNVYYPQKFWHPVLSSFIIYDDKDGRIVSERTKNR
jgi:hypothetical protein